MMAGPGGGALAHKNIGHWLYKLTSCLPHLQIFVVEFWGRRALLLLGFSTCTISCVVLTVALALQVRNALTGTQ